MTKDNSEDRLAARTRSAYKTSLALVLSLLLALASVCRAQTFAQKAEDNSSAAKDSASAALASSRGEWADEEFPRVPLRVERTPVAGGAELLTVFADLRGVVKKRNSNSETSISEEILRDAPLVSVLRDTLGDANPNNDRLRYVWMLTFARPNLFKRVASAVPFLYGRIGSQTKVSARQTPPPLVDLAATERGVWRHFFLLALQAAFSGSGGGFGLGATARTYQRNEQGYRKEHVAQALTILSLYESAQENAERNSRAQDSTRLLNESESQDIQARLFLADAAFGGVVDETHLDDAYDARMSRRLAARGHNWELLRQRVEAEGLYFDPLSLPDGSVTHALVWVAREDLSSTDANSVAGAAKRKFDSRFLNIADPFNDARLKNWKGYAETRFYDAEGRRVEKDAPGARRVELIPLALYGLDHPKIPILLTDFRNSGNAKLREASRRAVEDVTRNLFGLTPLGDLNYLVGRSIYSFLLGRRGADINQPTRLQAYSQLKILLNLSASLQPELREEIRRRSSKLALNPLDNDPRAEIEIARKQYQALLDYARRPDGLPAQIARDRQEELASTLQGKRAQFAHKALNTVSLGLYARREKLPDAEVVAQLDTARQLAFYRRFLREVALSSPRIEVVWDIARVRRALEFLAEQGATADEATAQAVSQIFARTEDEETRRLCLASLYRIDSDAAKSELVKAYRALTVSAQTSGEAGVKLKELCANYLQRATRERQRVSPEDAKAIAEILKNEPNAQTP